MELLKVCVFGAESTGKTTLCQRLAAEFQTVAVPEFAREYLEAKGGDFTLSDVEPIARGQLQAEETASAMADSIVFCDTDLLTTTIWSDWFFGQCPDWVKTQAALQRFDLTLFPQVDVPWVEDTVRYLPRDRENFQLRCRRELEAHRRRYVTISGNWAQRFEQARQACLLLLQGEGTRSGDGRGGASA